MQTVGPRRPAVFVVHQHTHCHAHVGRARVPQKKAKQAKPTKPPQPQLAAPAAQTPFEPRALSGVRRYVLPALIWLGDALMFILLRVNLGFGFQLRRLPFFGAAKD